MRLADCIKAIEESLEHLRYLSELQEDEKTKPFDKELRRHCFVRMFVQLATRLYFVRGNYDNRLGEDDLLYLNEQISVTSPLNSKKNEEGKFLIQGFTSRRNKLLHKYPFELNESKNNMYNDVFNYFRAHHRLLALGLNELKNVENQDFELEEICFSTPPAKDEFSEQSVSDIFSSGYLVQFELFKREFEVFIDALKNCSIDIADLIKKDEASEMKVEECEEMLSQEMRSSEYFRAAFLNFLENIFLIISKMNSTYGVICKKSGLSDSEQELFSKIDDLYEALSDDHKDYIGGCKKKRADISHEYVQPIDKDTMREDLFPLYELYENFFIPSLNEIRVSKNNRRSISHSEWHNNKDPAFKNIPPWRLAEKPEESSSESVTHNKRHLSPSVKEGNNSDDSAESSLDSGSSLSP